jgi:hypothetical protein
MHPQTLNKEERRKRRRKEKKTTDRHRQTEKKPKTQSKTVGLLINSHSWNTAPAPIFRRLPV